MKKEKRISYRAGITRSPSDFLCEDGELAECINLVTDNEELKTVVDPVEKITGTDVTVLYVHKFNDQERYIGFSATTVNNTSTETIVWGKEEGHVLVKESTLKDTDNNDVVYDTSAKLTSIGKTLILSRDSGMLYFLWNPEENDYECLGGSFPYPDIEYELKYRYHVHDRVEPTGLTLHAGLWSIDKQTDWNNCVVGLYSSLRKKMWRQKAFVGSFCVRAALELYDGTYYLIQNPVFMLNHFSAYCIGYLDTFGDEKLSIDVCGHRLYYRFHQDYTKWTDIVKNVVLFVTREADLFDTISDAILIKGADSVHANESICYYMNYGSVLADTTKVNDASPTAECPGIPHIILESNPDSNLKNVIEDGVYYKLCEIGIKGDNNERPADMHFDTHTIENITSQRQLVTEQSSDDYFSHCDINAGVMYSYNSRLNLAQVRRGFFDGFDYFMPFRIAVDGVQPPSIPPTYTFYVTIQSEDGNKTVERVLRDYNKQGIYFYYPDPRAKHVVIKKDGLYILDHDLKEHPTLNGAYYFAGVFWDMDEPQPLSPQPDDPVVSTDRYESLPNYILTSEVNNPFVFRPQGYYKVGTGRIIGMSTTTHALSEGQFGQFPLLVFSDNGIWALAVDSTGYYTSIHPVSREVCSNDGSITQTDGAVFFVSKKGLMVIVGSEVRCVSEQMNGMPFDTADLSELDDLPSPASPWEGVITPCQGSSTFLEFIRDSRLRIAYDYTDSRLLLINPAYGFAYAYGMADGSISKVILPGSVTNVVSDYPDYLLQAGDKVYTLYGKPREDEITARKTAFLLTRPMKLAGPLTVTSLRELVNVGMWDRDGGSVVKTEVWVSDDLYRWYLRSSRFGAAARYFRIGLFIKMKPTERLSGTIVMQQERRTDNKRT